MLTRHRHGRCLLLPDLTRLCTCASPTQHPAPSSASSDAAPDASPGGLDPAALAPDDAIAALPAVADSAGSAAALALFHRLAARPDLRLLMRLYATAATAFVARGNLPMAHEAMRAMVAAFAGAGRLREAADMVLEMRSHGLPLRVETANWVLRVGLRHPGLFTRAREVFDGMARAGGVRPDERSFRALVLGCCREGRFEEVDALLVTMRQSGFCLDNATCTVVVRAFCQQDRFKDVSELFGWMSGMGTPLNMVNYTAWIDGLCKKGYVKQAFHVLEEMVGKGLKPNVYTHTSLIDGLCKIGWTERAFRLFLKLVRSSSYKPNVHTYTVMIGGYCKEGKLARAEMLLGRMVEQGLAPNTNTYTTLINGHCKDGSFDRAFELMNKMKLEGFLPNIYTYNAIIGGFCRKGQIQEAYKVTYTILITEHCKQGHIMYALELFSRMAENVPTTTYTSMIAGYCKVGKSTSALKVFERMVQHGCLPDSITYGALISGLCKESRLEEARALYESMLDKHLAPCDVTCITLAFEYCRREKTSIAVSFLDRLDKQKQAHTVDALVRKLSAVGNLDAARLFLKNVLDKHYTVDHVTYTSFINSCYNSNRYALASEISEKISKRISNFQKKDAAAIA
ncbi:hypothetical protein PVAP13_8KG312706 [Panicum virgatum]|uniref:Pentatricopeptide repeat-containing protein n=1 Tax=Panicum virgatum TaxID=38727 RepID=A0A8T0PNT8_PANVG|nr:hypothetical protein PVAP13_8KG312706 [Panicum virgatum]